MIHTQNDIREGVYMRLHDGCRVHPQPDTTPHALQECHSATGVRRNGYDRARTASKHSLHGSVDNGL